MSIKLALLKSGEEVIADISEFRQKETDILICIDYIIPQKKGSSRTLCNLFKDILF